MLALIPYEKYRILRPRRRFFPAFFEPRGLRMFDSGEFSDLSSIKIDVSESDKEYKISAELPGFKKDEIDVKVDEDMLVLSAETKSEVEEEKEGFSHYEKHYGSFRRTFQIPEEVESEKIEAKMKDGVLTLTLPRNKEKAKDGEHRVTIQ
jgi:HSP20 family protein